MPVEPPSDPLAECDGTEQVRVRVGNRWRWMATALLRGLRGDSGPKGDKGPAGGAGPKGDPGSDGSPRRIEAFTSAKSNAAGVARVTFAPAFAAPPAVQPGLAWNGTQIVHAIPSNVTAAGCDLILVRSKGTLVLTSGPFELVASAAGTVIAFGN